MNTVSKAVAVSKANKRFGDVEAAKDISFEVEAGEIFGLIGPNGAGKTTVIRMLMDIIAGLWRHQDTGRAVQRSHQEQNGISP